MFQRLDTGWVTQRQLSLVRSRFGLQVQLQPSKKEKASKPKF
jgi:hypothetical protein